MKRFKDCVLVSDFDGTLINSNGTISEENIRAIEYFINEGGFFCGATGRTHLGIEPYQDRLPTHAPWILFNGGGVYDIHKKRFLHEENINDQVLKPLIKDVMMALPELNIQICTSRMQYFVNPNGLADLMMVSENQEYEICSMDDIDEAWIKLMFHGEPRILRKVEEILIEILDQEIYRYFYSGEIYLEVMRKEVSKGSGLKALKRILDDNEMKYFAIGDFFNDVEMLKWADISATPGNSPIEIKEISDITVSDNNNHAVRSFVEWLDKNIA